MQFKSLLTLVAAASVVVANPFLGEDWINSQSAAGAAAAGDASSSGVASGMNTAAGAASAGDSSSSGAIGGGHHHKHGIFGRELEELERRGWGGHRYGYSGYPNFGGYYPYYNDYYNDAGSAAASAASSGGPDSSSSTSAATRRDISEDMDRREIAVGEELELEPRGWYGRHRYGHYGYPYYGGYYPYGGFGDRFGAAASAAAASGGGAATSVAA